MKRPNLGLLIPVKRNRRVQPSYSNAEINRHLKCWIGSEPLHGALTIALSKISARRTPPPLSRNIGHRIHEGWR